MEDALKASEDGLALVDRARKQKGWNRQSAAWCDAALTSMASLKNFWQGKRIQRESFVRICQAVGLDWQQVAEGGRSPGVVDWGEAPEVTLFYGRKEEIKTLEQWLRVDRCKLVALLGMGGMGKTTLSAKLSDRLLAEFDFVVWRSLRNAPPFETLLSEILLVIHDNRDSSKLVINQMMEIFKSHRCLIVLDNAESILEETAAYRPGYELYGDWLRRVAEERHQSCVLLTSRELPREWSFLESDRVRSLQLTGLSATDGLQILERVGFFSASHPALRTIVEHYAGNPLALKIVAAGIRDVLGSNVNEFVKLLQQGGFVFGDIQDLLKRHFTRLSPREQEVVYWLAIAREPISLDVIAADLLSSESRVNLADTLSALQRRSLLEISTSGFSLQPAVMGYVSDRLVEIVSEELLSGTPDLARSHALMKAQAKDYIREAQVRLIITPILDCLAVRLRERGAIEGVVIALKNRLLQLRGRPAAQIGYLGGNLLNLLCNTGCQFSGDDFSNLILWQSYLRGVTLNRVNFSHSDLSKSAFSEVFSSILAIAFSPDGTRLYTSDDLGWVYGWQVSDGQQILAVPAHTEWVFSISLTPDGQTLATGSLDGTIALWNLATGNQIRTWSAHSGGVADIQFSADGQRLWTSGGDQTVKQWDWQTGDLITIGVGHSAIVRAIALSPNYPWAVTASLDQTLRVWSVETGECVRVMRDRTAVFAVAFTPDGEPTVVSGGDDGVIKLWDISRGDCLSIFEEDDSALQERLWRFSFHPNETNLLACGGDRTVQLWDWQKQLCLKTLSGHESRIWSVAFSPMNNILASGSEDKLIKFWDGQSGHCLRTLQGYSNSVDPIAFLEDDTQLMTFSSDQHIRLWDIATQTCLQTLLLPTKAAFQAALSPDRQWIASGGLDYVIHVLDRAGTDRRSLLGHTAWVRSVNFSPDSQLLASASGDCTVKLWEIHSGGCLHTFVGHDGPVQAIAFSPDGQWLASGSWDQQIKIWDVKTGICLHTLVGHTHRIGTIAFIDSQTLVSGAQDCQMRVWNLTPQRCDRILTGHTGGIMDVAISPDAQQLASIAQDRTVRLWNLATGQIGQTWEGMPYGGVRWSSDGQWLASSARESGCQVRSADAVLHQTLQVSRPYEGLVITGIQGLTNAQIATLCSLGAMIL